VTEAPRAVLLDIEGTTTPIAFVYRTLFPYARTRLRRFLDAHDRRPDVTHIVDRLRHEQATDPEAPPGAALEGYVEWLMDRDRKSTPLKELQGLIWDEGFRSGELVGELFADVPPALEAWQREGIGVGIFSSGSVHAQQLLFRHSSAGDLTPLLRWHFDTSTGRKTAPESYRRIVETIGMPADRVLFVSDVVAELDAAQAAGLRTALSERPGNAAVPDVIDHPRVRSFADLEIVASKP
jgi:enolase-phosphatase E1